MGIGILALSITPEPTAAVPSYGSLQQIHACGFWRRGSILERWPHCAMSRSYHITKKQAVKQIADGDFQPLVEHTEKGTLKKLHKRYRKIYNVIHPSAESKSRALRNSVSRSAMRGILKPKQAEYIEQKENAAS